MPLQIPRFRRGFAIGAVTVVAVVAGAYFYARHRIQGALKQVPEKIGIEIQQSAKGFTISKSEAGRTIFKIQASKAIQFKEGGRAELHDVNVTLYGRDSSRFDQIYGAKFEYDPQSGDVIAKGEVQIDLEANPEGLTKPDQVPPKELKNPIHLKTSGLVFNQKTGNAYTKEKVEFRIPQASGSAVGVEYAANSNVLTLRSQVQVVFNGPSPVTLDAVRGAVTKNPRVVVLERPHLRSTGQRSQAEQATLYLRPDNTVERMVARGGVQIQSEGKQSGQVRAAQLELLMAEHRDTLRTAVFSGDVQLQSAGQQPMQGAAGRLTINFVGKNLVSAARAEDNVKLVQHQQPATPSASPQDLEITAPVVDFFLAQGRRLERAETSGPPQIVIRPTGPAASGQQTMVTAGKFEARLDDKGRLASVHGAPDARIVNSAPQQPDRVSTSDTLDATFRPSGGIDAIVQQGNFAYVDGGRKAWADRARYTPQDQMLVLTGSPRVAEGGMTTTAHTLRLNRSTGDAFADADVKSTYSDLKPQPDGALLASSSPIHVTARAMTARHSSATALYSGNARLWQEANVVEAPSLEFDRNRRSVVAQGAPAQPVSTVLIQTDKQGKPTPVVVKAARLTYTDNQRTAHYEGGVTAQGAGVTTTAAKMDVILRARGQDAGNQSLTPAGKLDQIIAEEHVVVAQAGRKAEGERLVYTAAEDKFVMTGGPPSIFDAEQGKITGVSLTFYRHDDRVLVEGNDQSPTVTRTRVAR